MGRIKKPGYVAPTTPATSATSRKPRARNPTNYFLNDPSKVQARLFCWERKIAGDSYKEIADQANQKFGLEISPDTVAKYIYTQINHLTEEQATFLRRVESARLDHYLTKLEHRIEMGDDKAITSAIRISERRSKLLGLDAPVVVQGTVTTDVDPELLAMVQEAKQRRRDNPAITVEVIDNVVEAEVVTDVPDDAPAPPDDFHE